MKRKRVSAVALILLLTGMWALAFNIQPAKSEPKTWYVDDSGGADFTRIQDAVYAASAGDTIYVYNGTYYEHIYISKSLTLIGENKYATIIDGYGWTDAAIRIYWTNRVNLTGFTVRNAGYGISVRYSNNNRFFGNIISDVGNRGIELYPDSWNNIISGNTISDVTGYPAAPGVGGRIAIWLSLYGNIVDSNIISKSECGIYLGGPPEKWSHDNIVEGNVISNNDAYGINVWGYNNRIIGNTITNMGYVGIQLNSPDGHPNQCTNNVVSGNVISQSTFGINLIMAAFSNMIERDDVLSSNGLGILLGDSDNNTVRGNLVSNAYYGILLFSSDDTKVYHNNFVDNTQQVLLSESFNTAWDNGYPSGGNYWSDYVGVDADGDGIGDTPYVIDVYNQDSYPLMAPINMFDAGTWNGTSYSVDVVSNSTISDFYFNISLEI